MLFDGRKFAKDREILLRDKVGSLSRKPVLASVLVGENRASELYTKIKKNAAQRVGVKFKTYRVNEKESKSELMKKLKELDGSEADGVMVQLPLPVGLDKDTVEILAAIGIEKDVDGLRWQESGITPATVRAVLSILDDISKSSEDWSSGFWGKKFVVVGYTGNVGAPLTSFLQKRGVEVEGVNSKTENVSEILCKAGVVISCVGKPGLIKADDVSEDAVVVDIGIDMIDGRPRGDMGAGVYEKASMAVPVPGGVGPVTVVSLLENLVDLVC